jgi:spore germination protein GerM
MKRTPSILLLGVMVTILAACGASTGGLGTLPPVSPTPAASPAGPDETPDPSGSGSPSSAPSEAPGSSSSPDPSAQPSSDTIIVRGYLVLAGAPGSEGLVPVLREVPATTAVARAAMTALLAGPTTGEGGSGISTAIPDGTRLLGLTIKNGVATVDLSTEFDSGGGSASMQYRLGQVVYTLTQFSTVKSVVFQVEGETVTVFGGEGIVLDGPVARDDYNDLLPDIFVDRPAWRAALGNPGRVTGNANVFEATFRISLLDASGAVLADEMVMATCGTGCRGTFDVTLRYAVAKGQYGTLRAYNPSAKDGTPESIREYPVWLVPAS